MMLCHYPRGFRSGFFLSYLFQFFSFSGVLLSPILFYFFVMRPCPKDTGLKKTPIIMCIIGDSTNKHCFTITKISKGFFGIQIYTKRNVKRIYLSQPIVYYLITSTQWCTIFLVDIGYLILQEIFALHILGTIKRNIQKRKVKCILSVDLRQKKQQIMNIFNNVFIMQKIIH